MNFLVTIESFNTDLNEPDIETMILEEAHPYEIAPSTIIKKITIMRNDTSD